MHASIPSVMQSVLAMMSIKCDYHAGCHEMWERMSCRDVRKNVIQLSCRGEQICNEGCEESCHEDVTKVLCRYDECCQTDEWKAVMQT